MQTSDQVAGEARENCAHCGARMSAEEREFYGASCDRCETEMHRAFEEGREPILPPPSTVVKYLKARAERAEANARRLETEIAALRAQPERGAEEWNYDMNAAPKGPGSPVLVSVPSFADGHAPFVGEAYYHEDEPNEGWWWSGTSPSDYWAGPIRETNAEPIAWRHLPEPAAIRALPLHPAKDEGGGR